MTEKTYDAAVVGASIAGYMAAPLLAREGASVALIERHSDPNAYKALCTHFIPRPCPPSRGSAFCPSSKRPGRCRTS